MYFTIYIYIYIYIKRMMCNNKKIITRLWPFDCSKPFAYEVSREYLVQVFSHVFICLTRTSFLNCFCKGVT
jgi:hypothetical protein